MSFSTIQTLGQLRSHLIANTTPSLELAERAAFLCQDPTRHIMLSRITAGRELAGARLWVRIADHLDSDPRGGAAVLPFAAICTVTPPTSIWPHRSSPATTGCAAPATSRTHRSSRSSNSTAASTPPPPNHRHHPLPRKDTLSWHLPAFSPSPAATPTPHSASRCTKTCTKAPGPSAPSTARTRAASWATPRPSPSPTATCTSTNARSGASPPAPRERSTPGSPAPSPRGRTGGAATHL